MVHAAPGSRSRTFSAIRVAVVYHVGGEGEIASQDWFRRSLRAVRRWAFKVFGVVNKKTLGLDVARFRMTSTNSMLRAGTSSIPKR